MDENGQVSRFEFKEADQVRLQQCLRPEFLVAWLALFALVTMTFLASAVEMPVRRGRLSASDYRFAVAAARDNTMNVDLGRMAVKKTGSLKVRQFAEEMVHDHELDNKELANVVSENGATLPENLTYAQQSEVVRLGKLSGPAFDREYMALMLREHLKYLTQFSAAGSTVHNAGLRKFASNTAKIARYDLNMAKAFKRR